MSKPFIESGSREVELGNEAESKGQREKAIGHLRRSLGHYQLAIKHERPGPLRTRLVNLTMDIIEKTERLEAGILTQPQVATQPLVEKDGAHHDESKMDQFQQIKPEILPDIGWDDIIGLESVKNELKMTVQYPMEIPQIYVGNRQAVKGILLYGPPGVGKTMIVKVLAKECGISFFSISSAEIISKWVGDSAKNMKALFEKVKACKPAILFIDEIEAMCPSKDGAGGNVQHSGEAMKVVNEILTQMNGLTSDAGMDGVLVIGATNYPWLMDDAILRRFPRRIYLPLPEREDRLDLLQYLLARNRHDIGPPLEPEDLENLADSTELFSNFDLTELIRFACNLTTEEIINGNYFRLFPTEEGKFAIIVTTEEEILQDTNIKAWCVSYKELKPELKALLKSRAINMSHLARAMKMTKPVTSKEKLKLFEKWTKEHGSSLL